MTEFMLPRRFRGRNTKRLALVIFTLILFGISAPSARALTYSYVGPAFDSTQCYMAGYTTSPPCTDGAVTGSITFTGVPTGYTGNAGFFNVESWNLDAAGIGSLNTSNIFNGWGFVFSNGELLNWHVQAFDSSPSSLVITTLGFTGGYDDAGKSSSGTVTAVGFVLPSVYGHWTNGKQLGRPASMPHIPDPTPIGPIANAKPPPCPLAQCGDPIDIASGNMFEQVTDYETAGQNKLGFVRYYNSIATPDTLATALGRNWRSNYDRYLRVVSTTEIDAERPDGQVVSFVLVSGT